MEYKKKYMKYKSKYLQLKQTAGGKDPINELYKLMKKNYKEDIKKLGCINSSMDIKILIIYYIDANLTNDSSDFFHLYLIHLRKNINILARKKIFEKYELARLYGNQVGIVSVQQDMIRKYLAAILQDVLPSTELEILAFIRLFGCNVKYNGKTYEFDDSIDNKYILPELTITDTMEMNNPNNLPRCILAKENYNSPSFGIKRFRDLDINGETLSV